MKSASFKYTRINVTLFTVYGILFSIYPAGVGYCLFSVQALQSLMEDKRIDSALFFYTTNKPHTEPAAQKQVCFMKKIFKTTAIALCIAVTASSCGTMMLNSTNSSTTLTNVELTHANYRVVKNVEGFASASYILAIGGLSRKAVRDNAIADMMRKANMTGSQAIVNVHVKNHFATVLGFYTRVSCSATAQVIEFLPEADEPIEHHHYNGAERLSESMPQKHYNIDKTYNKSPKQYNIGDLYDDGKIEGYVFEVSSDGLHGKIVYPKALNKSQWCTKEGKSNNTTKLIDTDGENNMRIIRTLPDWQNNYPAFAACAELGESWYLPSINEVISIRKTLNRQVLNEIIPNLHNTDIWTSTAPNAKVAITLNYNGVSVTNKLHVLAVSKF